MRNFMIALGALVLIPMVCVCAEEVEFYPKKTDKKHSVAESIGDPSDRLTEDNKIEIDVDNFRER